MTAIIPVCIKKTSKLVNFCVAILILKMKESKQLSQYIVLYYFKKVKTQLKCKKDLCSVWRRCCG